jgi:hypothetical protein
VAGVANGMGDHSDGKPRGKPQRARKAP